MKKRTILTATILLITMSVSACGMRTNVAGGEKAGIPGTEETQTMEDASTTVTEPGIFETEQDVEENTEEASDTETDTTHETVPKSDADDNQTSQGGANETSTTEQPETKPETPKEKYTYSDMAKTMYAKSSVNVRTLPSTDGDKLGKLSKGDAVAVTGKCNETGWYRIEFKGKEGYVSGNYLVATAPVEDTKPSTPDTSWEYDDSEEEFVPEYYTAEDHLGDGLDEYRIGLQKYLSDGRQCYVTIMPTETTPGGFLGAHSDLQRNPDQYNAFINAFRDKHIWHIGQETWTTQSDENGYLWDSFFYLDVLHPYKHNWDIGPEVTLYDWDVIDKIKLYDDILDLHYQVPSTGTYYWERENGIVDFDSLLAYKNVSREEFEELRKLAASYGLDGNEYYKQQYVKDFQKYKDEYIFTFPYTMRELLD